MARSHAWSSTASASPSREKRPTLAVATVVLDSPGSIGRWIRHHVRIGALDVLLYANRATIDTVAAAATGHSAVMVFPLEDVVAARGDSAWFLSWRSCARCCEGAIRPSSVPGMCERRMFVAPQGHAARHMLAMTTADWVILLDVDEYFAGDGRRPDAWRAFLRRVDAPGRAQPGGLKVTQLQMLAPNSSLGVSRDMLVPHGRAWPEQKSLVRRVAMHPHPWAYGSVHEATLAEGWTYAWAPPHLLGAVHFRYNDWTWQGRKGERLGVLGCLRNETREGADELRAYARICASKRAEVVRWQEQLSARPRTQLEPGRLPEL